MRSQGWTRAFNALGCLALLVGLLAGLINRQVLDGDRFAHHVDTMRRDPAVARQVGQAVTKAVLAKDPDLVAVRPLVESVATALVSSTVFSPIVRATARQVHVAFTQADAGGVVLRLADVGAVLVPALTALSPSAAARIPPDLSVTLTRIGSQSFAARTIHLTRFVKALALLPLLSLALFLLAGLLGRDRLRAIVGMGWAIVGAGVGVGLVGLAGATAASVADEDTFSGSVLGAGWRELAGFFWWIGAITVLAGGLVVATATPRIPQLEPAAVFRRAWHSVAHTPTDAVPA